MAERRALHRTLAIAAGALAMLAAVAGDATRDEGRVTALELARWIRDGSPPLLLLDLRSRDEFDEYRLPGARHVSPDDVRTVASGTGIAIVLYAGSPEPVATAGSGLRSRGAREVLELEGGVAAWIEQVERPRLPPLSRDASSADSAARREHLALSRHFGGLPVVDPSLAPSRTGARDAEATQDAREAVQAVRRRGC